MKITTVLLDLDGTLLPMDLDVFLKSYFKLLAEKVAPFGYDPTSLIDNIWAGTVAMIKNDGSRKNEEAFWAQFAKFYGDKVYDDIPVFDKFYAEEFNLAKMSAVSILCRKRSLTILKKEALISFWQQIRYFRMLRLRTAFHGQVFHPTAFRI